MTKEFSKTHSVCPVCLKVIEARRVIGDDGNIYLEKSCPEHGEFSALIWEGGIVPYLMWDTSISTKDSPVNAKPEKDGCPYDCGLCEKHERAGCCVLLELTTRCNLRCPVCFASAGEGEGRDTPLSELSAQYDMLMAHGGPFNIQLSGGEPTVRDDLPEIIALGREKGFSFLQLNTNGLRLAQEPGFAEILKNSGLSCVFLQFDGMDDDVFRTMRGRPLLSEKLAAIDSCAKAGLPVVLVPTIAPDVNENQIGDILRFALSHIPDIRGVHFQPVSYFGRCGLDASKARITIPRMLREIEAQTDGLFKAGDFSGGGAESPYCSFHVNYIKKDDGNFRALPRRQSECCCKKSAHARDFVARQWSDGKTDTEGYATDMTEISSLDAFLNKAHENTFAVSGMLFQDAFTIDFDRLRRCYIIETDSEKGMVPFCAYNLSSISGEYLYRK